jgi:hypothetical protein
MAAKTRGKRIRELDFTDILNIAMVAIPTEQKHQYANGYDVPVVVEAKRHKIREKLWEISRKEKISKGAIYLSTRPIWLVAGEQDEAARRIAVRMHGRSAAEQLTEAERDAVGLHWLMDRLGRAGVKVDSLPALLGLTTDEE